MRLETLFWFFIGYGLWLPVALATAVAVFAVKRRSYRLVWLGGLAILAAEMLFPLALGFNSKGLLEGVLAMAVWGAPSFVATSGAAVIGIRMQGRPAIVALATFVAGLLAVPVSAFLLPRVMCHFFPCE